MRIVAGTGEDAEDEVKQAAPIKMDDFGLRAAGFCPELYDLVFVNGYPVEWLWVATEEIVL